MNFSFEGYPDLKFKEGETILEFAIRNQIPLNHSCGGNATCGTCRVLVTSNLEHLPERNEVEKEISEDRSFSEFERLACQLNCGPNLTVKLPD
ncbi:MAG: hypothetical protein CL677_03975 [Bdellovibrionaceae bacterium]|nr:hypothetical protein [Pseudobdellovibrionaceae bacterium]